MEKLLSASFLRSCAAKAREEAAQVPYDEIRDVYLQLAELWERRAAGFTEQKTEVLGATPAAERGLQLSE